MKKKILFVILTVLLFSSFTFYLTACGENKHTHYYAKTTVAPTCTENGYTIYRCACGEEYKDNYLNAKGHNYTKEIVAPTCTEQGYTLYKCACGKEYKDDYVNAEHKYVFGVCSVCGSKTQSSGLQYTLNNDGMSYSVTGMGSCKDKDIVIPSSYSGKPVTCIEEDAFYMNSSLISVFIPNSVESIKDYAFGGCSNLVSVLVGSGITFIGNNAFSSEKLVEVYNLSKLNIEKESFDNGGIGYSALDIYTNINTPSKISYLNGYIMYNNGNTHYLLGYKGNDTELTLPTTDYKYEIYKSAFADNKNIKKVTISDSATCIKDYAFENCSSLESATLSTSITSIGWDAFIWCKSLKSITIPSSVTSIEYGAFRYCDSLKSVTFKDTTTWYRTFDSTSWKNKSGGTLMDVTNPTTNATYFNESRDFDYYWYKV